MKRMKYLLAAALLVNAASSAFAASCGTVGSPTACSLNIGGNRQFTASGFQLVATSGTTPYQAGDILIEILAGGGGTVSLQFSKNSNGPTPGIVFAANAGGNASFIISYDATIAPVIAGTAAFTDAAVAGTFSAAGNGFSAVQFIVPAMIGCLASSTGSSFLDCDFPGGIGTTTSAGTIANLSGNTGNTSIARFSNQFSTSFTPAPTSDVPEPSSFALLGLGLSGLAWFRRRAAH